MGHAPDGCNRQWASLDGSIGTNRVDGLAHQPATSQSRLAPSGQMTSTGTPRSRA
jgi:hypothetical protein